jgi:hypothetical protein
MAHSVTLRSDNSPAERAVSEVQMRRWTAPALRATVISGAVAVLVGTLTACGPSYRFESSAADDVVIKMPRSWNMVQSGVPANSDGTAAATGNWLAVFDSASRPSLDHVRSHHATSPVAVLRTLVVTKEEGTAATPDDLRDLLYPVSAAGRSSAGLTGFTGTDFQLLSDQTINSKTAHGVHVVYSYNLGEGVEVYDQVAVTDASHTRVHVFFVHCSQACYTQHRSDIAETMKSFTVKMT